MTGERGERGRQLLLIGINYAPEETGIAPYTTALAEGMIGRGWQVTVITGMPHYPQWRVFPEYRGALRALEQRGAVELRRVRHYTTSRQSAIDRALYESTFLAQAITLGTLPRPDCVVGVVPSLAGGVAGTILARRYQVPLGLIFQDLVGQAAAQSGMPGGSIAARPAQAIEGWVARAAARVGVVAETFRPYLERAGVKPDRISHLPNWTHVGAPSGRSQEVRESLGWTRDEQVILHAGNMGYKQELGNVVEAARLASVEDLPCRFVLMGDGNDRRRLEGLASGIRNVQFLDPQPESTFVDILAAADVLVVNERATVRDMSLPSKITSYFKAGRPVVAAVSPGGATAKELEHSGGAVIVPAGQPGVLLHAIRELHRDPAVGEDIARRAAAYAAENLDGAALARRAERFVSELVVPTPVRSARLGPGGQRAAALTIDVERPR